MKEIKSEQPLTQISQATRHNEVNDNASKFRQFKLAKLGVTAAITVGGIVLATQQAQAISALAIVNGLTASSGVTVSKDILYGEEATQDLDIYYPKRERN